MKKIGPSSSEVPAAGTGIGFYTETSARLRDGLTYRLPLYQ